MVSQDDTLSEVDPITIEVLEVELKKLRNSKATGLDGIISELLKYGVKDLMAQRLTLFSKCWKECKFPKTWLQAKVISLFKKAQQNCCCLLYTSRCV